VAKLNSDSVACINFFEYPRLIRRLLSQHTYRQATGKASFVSSYMQTRLMVNTSVAKAMKVLRNLRCLQIEVGIVQSLCRNDCHQVILLGQVLEIVE